MPIAVGELGQLDLLDRERIWRGVYDVLTGKDTSNGFASLSHEDRKAILDIVRETKFPLPDYWRAGE